MRPALASAFDRPRPAGWLRRAGKVLDAHPFAVWTATWSAVTLLNLTKAFHIDDTAHLEIAQHILKDPAHPMRGEVYWGARPAPIWELNQPHLFFFLVAAVMRFAGASEIALHLLTSVFTALAMWGFHRLAKHFLRPELRLLSGTAFFLGPAFIASQNVMTDVPLLAMWLWFFVAMVEKRLAWAAVAASLACLTKYTGAVLVAVLLADLVARRDAKRAWVLAIVALALGSWSLWNLADYGGVHLLGRRIEVASVGGSGAARLGIIAGRLGLWFIALGGVFTLGLMWRPRSRAAAVRSFLLVAAGTLVGLVLSVFGPPEMRGQSWVVAALRAAFLLNGVAATVGLLAAARLSGSGEKDRKQLLLLGLFASTTLFIAVLSPFVAVRHVLLALPMLYLWLPARRATPSSKGGRAALLPLVVAHGVGSVLGIGVALGDAELANVYRREAPRLAREGLPGRDVYFTGHWGWQWYAQQAGMRPYVPGQSVLRAGDTLIAPELVDQPPIDARDRSRLNLVATRAVPGSPWMFPRTVTRDQGYYAVWQGVPYTFTRDPLERFHVYRVGDRTEPAGADDAPAEPNGRRAGDAHPHRVASEPTSLW